MNAPGSTRTRITPTHALLAPDGHIRTSLPGWQDAEVVVLISPQLGARFSQYLAHLKPGGRAAAQAAGLERFIYVLNGKVTLMANGETHALGEGGYAHLPAGAGHTLTADEPASLNVFERRYVPLAGAAAPQPLIGHDTDLPAEPFLGDEGLRVRKLLPEAPGYDMAVNTMTFDPGVALPLVETHVMEHGLLMLQGAGIYRLADDWYPVTAGDAIFMAPYCPQWFGALGKGPATYLLYKDNHREPFALEAGS